MQHEHEIPAIQHLIIGLILTVAAVLLYVLSRYNYLLFHGIVEVYSIIIAAGIFIVVWNTRQFNDSQGLVFLGIAYLAVAALDFLHTFSYVGTGTFPDHHYYANQLWIIARLVESLSIALYTSINWNRVKFSNLLTFAVYGIITLLAALSVLVLQVFPAAFIEGQGQTSFKIFSGYLVIAILLLSVILMFRQRYQYDPKLYSYFTISIVLTMMSELAFTLYTDNYGVSNVVGHILKIISFYMIYRSVIVNVLQRPYAMLFSNLVKSEQSLVHAVDTKNRFFNIIAHDLRNPFNIIINLSNVLSQLGKENNSPEIIEYTRYIHETSLHTFRLLENLLTWAQVQTDRIRFSPRQTDVSQLINEILYLTRLAAENKNITIASLEGPNTHAHCDPDMLKTIIRNLLSNAVKFTKDNGEISISTYQRENSWGFQVRDNGLGMSAKLQADLYSFQMNTSRLGTEDEKGTGLGLILCREFVELHGGRMIIESAEDAGCTVTCDFPKQNHTSAQALQTPSQDWH